MENAVKALLMAAGVLIGMMILSLGVSLYTSLSGYVESTQNEIIANEIRQFNNQFTKFINYNEDTNAMEFTLTIHDIVTAANTAYENNKHYQISNHREENYYVTVKLDGVVLEKNITSNSANMLLNGLGQEYKCSSADIKISQITGRVYEVNFYKYNTI